ncbi:MAG: ABC transporter ATP-binding protein/permease [Coriobacteriia bacterium]|nr:ABC transporter ATP-binding protein/permease [Coriobacteriia bacterium]
MLRKLFSYLGQYKTASIVTPLLVTFETGFDILIPFFMAIVIDKGLMGTGTRAQNMAIVYRYAIILVGCAIIALIIGFSNGRTAAYASAGFSQNLRHALYEKIQGFSFSNIDKFSTSGLVTRLTTDVTNIQNAYQLCLRIMVRAPLTMLLCFIVTFSIDRTISLIFLGSLIIMGICLTLIITNAHPIFRHAFRRYDVLNRIVEESVHGVRVVKSFVREKLEITKFRRTSQVIRDDFTHAEKIFSLSQPLMQFMVFVSLLVVYYVSAHEIVGGRMQTGNLMAFITYILLILNQLMMLSTTLVMVTIAISAGQRIVRVLDEEPAIANPAAPVMAVADGSINFSGVDFSYTHDYINDDGDEESGGPPTQVLFDVDLQIDSGQTIGVLGGTGSSKSTLVQLIARLYDVNAGTLKVGGVDVRDYDLETLRDNVAIVLQQNVLFAGTIAENLRWGAEDATDEDLRRAARMAQAEEFISKLPDGYDTYIEQGGSNVSGGQKQRLCIARALLKSPQVIILDDSTSAVDMKTDALLRKAFAEEIPQVTKIIVAQRISSVMDADKILVMDRGRINGFGTHDELMASNAIYADIYESQLTREEAEDAA